jgi:hypothetical protein
MNKYNVMMPRVNSLPAGVARAPQPALTACHRWEKGNFVSRPNGAGGIAHALVAGHAQGAAFGQGAGPGLAARQ